MHVLYFCICPCSAQLSMFHVERRSRNTLIINIIFIIINCLSFVGKTQYMTNHADSEDILIDQQKIEKVTEFKYLGQTTHLKDTTKEEIYARIRAAWSCFGKK